MPAAPDTITPLRSTVVVGGWVGWRLDNCVSVLTNEVWFWSVVIAATAWTGVSSDGIGRPA